MCGLCTGTQSGISTLCSQTALAMYLGSDKPDARGPWPSWPCREQGTSLNQAAVPLYPISW